MQMHQARNQVKDTFGNGFDKNRFYYFIKNLLNEIDEDDKDKFIYRGNFIPDAYKTFIKTLERIGKYQDSSRNKIDILIVQLKKETSLEHARTMQRNFVAWYLNGSRGDVLKDAALVAFVSPNQADWRFSLVRMDYNIGEAGKIKQELTPAKRFSFLVGENEASHTAQSKLAPLIEDDKNNPTLDQLEEVFNIEKVTKEFFEKYRELFLWVKDELEKLVKKDEKIKKDFEQKGVNTVDFSKKLLGQIVFLYFLQKKGWFGVQRDEDWGTGPKDFLRRLFEKQIADYKNFFNEILEPLFYEALSTDREQNDYYYSQFNCKIPFLNGGLFDPLQGYDWMRTDINLPDELFSNLLKTKEGDTGTGILDIFDRFNFTVKEDEPLDKEVAVDPEMLGKVFENLLEVKDRKSKGTYYTPREIVHYMCQQSLINYLSTELKDKVKKNDIETLIQLGETAIEHDSHISDNGKETPTYSYKLPESVRKNARLIDEKLADIKVCDPAIGSGAFPVGMMNIIVKTRNVLNSYIKEERDRSTYDFKRHAIANSLYGVDIDLGAVEIAKLRLWLSLIVDEQDIKKIKPLPNLDYKIMQGNSLIELLSPDLVRKGADQEKNKLIDQLSELKNQYFEATSRKVKLKLRDQINELIVFIANYDKAKELEHSKNLLANLKAQKSLFSLEPENLTLGELESKEVKKLKKKVQELEKIKDTSPEDHFEWHLNFNEVFDSPAEASAKARENGGFDVVIANPPYVRADSKDPSYLGFRKKLLKLGHYKTLYEKWDLFIPFIEKSFYLLNQNGRLSFIVSNAICTSKYAFKLLDLIQENYYPLLVDYFENMHVFDAGVVPVVLHIQKSRHKSKVKKIIRDKEFRNITSLEKFSLDSFKQTGRIAFKKDYYAIDLNIDFVNLGDVFYISKGMVLNSDEKSNKGAFAKNDLISNTKDNIHIKKYLEGKNLKAYLIEKIQYLEWGTHRAPNKLSRPTFPELYDRPKIMRGRVTEGVYDDKGLLCNDSILLFVRFCDLYDVENNSISVSITKNNDMSRAELERLSKKFYYKYVLAILNSKFASLFLNNVRRHRLKNYFYPDDFRKLPIANVSKKKQKMFVKLVNQIRELTYSEDFKSNSEKQTRFQELLNKIDHLVYKLYDLTPKEIEIIEKNTN